VEQLQWLGAAEDDTGCWRLVVLEGTLVADLAAGVVRVSEGKPASSWWTVLVLHYLSVSVRPTEEPWPGVAFADLPGGRSYAPVYQGRVIARLCGTIGRDRATLAAAVEKLGGRELCDEAVAPADLACEFRVFPRVAMRLYWYAGDEEFSPSAVLLLPKTIASFFGIEDIVVLSERLVARLAGGSV
jgi:hypothetical protein